MILLPVDEGYAYDFLAICQVKYEKGVQEKHVFDFYSDSLRKQVGVGAHRIILESPEYAECVRVNTVTFDRVDDAKADRVKASVVHNFNNDRYIAKKNLQRRFFPDSEITERKN